MADHAFTHRPPPGASRTTLVLLHGTGGDEHQLLELGRVLDPEAGRLGIRGNVLEGGHPRFFRRLAEGVFDHDDVARRADDLDVFLGRVAAELALDPDGLVAVGFSNGANIAAATALRHPDRFRALVLFSAMDPLPDAVPGDLSHLAVLQVQGRHDPHAPPDQAERLAARFRDADAATEVVWHDDGHALGPTQVEIALGWLRRWRAATAADAGASPP